MSGNAYSTRSKRRTAVALNERPIALGYGMSAIGQLLRAHPGPSVQTAPPLRSGRSAQIGLRNFETH
jgi:hypothetical protein